MEFEKDRKDCKIRLRLTDKCNFRCFFCHDEGGHSEDDYTPGTDETLALVEKLWEDGRRDFSLTGGEPIVNTELLERLLDWFSTKGSEARVSLITNGELLNLNIVERLARCANRKIHISIHTADTEKYQAITGQRRVTPAEISRKLALAASKGITLKVNAVLLKNVNSEWEDIYALLRLASESGAKYVKLIEFLVTNEKYYDQYIKSDYVIVMLKKRFGAPVFSNMRTTTFDAADFGLLVEVTKCSCGVGCESCAHLRDDTFTGSRFYHPCMLDSLKYDLEKESLEECYRKGDSFVEIMAEKYGKHSPALIRYDEYVSGYKGVIFSISEDAFMRLGKGAEQMSLKKFKDVHVRMPEGAQNAFKMKIRHNEHEAGTAKMILYKESYLSEKGWDWYTISFIDNEQEAFNAPSSLMNRFLDVMGCSVEFESKHERRMFQKEGLVFSLEKIEGSGYFVYFSEREIDENGDRIRDFVSAIEGKPVKAPHIMGEHFESQ